LYSQITNNKFGKFGYYFSVSNSGAGAVSVYFFDENSRAGGCLSVRDKSQRSCLPLSLFLLSVPSMLMFKSLPSYPVQTIPVLVSHYRTMYRSASNKTKILLFNSFLSQKKRANQIVEKTHSLLFNFEIYSTTK
jgi:hypothetical protein